MSCCLRQINLDLNPVTVLGNVPDVWMIWRFWQRERVAGGKCGISKGISHFMSIRCFIIALCFPGYVFHEFFFSFRADV